MGCRFSLTLALHKLKMTQGGKLAGTGAMYRFSHGGRTASFKDKDSGHFILKRYSQITKGTDCEPQAQQTATDLLGFQGGEWTQGSEGLTMGQMAVPILLT